VTWVAQSRFTALEPPNRNKTRLISAASGGLKLEPETTFMHDLIIAVAIFHTLSSLTLLGGCAATSLIGPLLRRETLRLPIAQSELDADAILSSTAPVSTTVRATADSQMDVTAVA
jgi:hypothetical protein